MTTAACNNDFTVMHDYSSTESMYIMVQDSLYVYDTTCECTNEMMGYAYMS